MGFTTGFTGGVTLTLGVAYLTVLAHQRNRQAQGDILRTQAHVLSALAHDPASPRAVAPLPPTRADLDAAARASFAETAKERWNAEVEGVVRWAQSTDWDGLREDAEGVLGRLWRYTVGSDGNAAARDAKQGVETSGREAVRETKQAVRNVEARTAERMGSVATAAKNALEETRATTARAVDRAGEQAEEAKAASKGVVKRGMEKGRELVGRARAAVGLAEERFDTRADAALLHLSDVEKALHQRFEKNGDVMSKSVEEVLSERYKPIDQRDNTVLRGI